MKRMRKIAVPVSDCWYASHHWSWSMTLSWSMTWSRSMILSWSWSNR
jgi:hypothetical protein